MSLTPLEEHSAAPGTARTGAMHSTKVAGPGNPTTVEMPPGAQTLADIVDMKRCGPVPLYFQLACGVESAISKGIIKSGTRLPSENTMAKEFHLALNTVRQALSYLEGRSVLTRSRQHGTIVR